MTEPSPLADAPHPTREPSRLAGDRAPERRPARRRRQAVAVVASVAVHAAILIAVLSMHRAPPPPVDDLPVDVALVMAPRAPLEAPPLPPAPPAAAAAAKAKAKVSPPPAPAAHVSPLPPPPDIKTLAAAKAPSTGISAELTASEIAGAATAGSGGNGEGGGGGGGACNMVRRVQAALRKDHLVLAAAGAPETAGKALKVWDGDWVQHTGQDGRGLAAVREAIMWEVGFAPAACRAESVHGLVLFSLNDGPGATRLALGSGVWRWSDLLTPRGVGGH